MIKANSANNTAKQRQRRFYSRQVAKEFHDLIPKKLLNYGFFASLLVRPLALSPTGLRRINQAQGANKPGGEVKKPDTYICNIISRASAVYMKYAEEMYAQAKIIQVKGDVIALNGSHSRATERHLPYGIPQCYLPPNTGERAPS